MLTFSYNKSIDEANWKRLINNKAKFGHAFPETYSISDADIIEANIKVGQFQKLWNKYDNTFEEKMPMEFRGVLTDRLACYVNTSPYSSFNAVDDYLSISVSRESHQVIPTILHEINHFVFYKKYFDACLAMDYSMDDISNIKEIITVINNDIFYPMEDSYWEIHQKSRDEVFKVWLKSKNMKEVIIAAKNSWGKYKK